jgi:DAACS family dicarboxylate/amino acid:cation (Na+ or H+) symporter
MAAGLVAGVLLGLAAAVTRAPPLLALAHGLEPLGAVFVNLLSMVVLPLVASALFSSLAGLGDIRKVGRLGARTLGFFWGSTLVAIVIGFALAELLLPLGGVPPEAQGALRAAAGVDSAVLQRAAERAPSAARFLVDLVPANPLRAAVDGNLLGVIVFVTIFALATTALPPEKRAVLTALADAVTQTLIRIMHWVLAVAPLGICALVAPAVAEFGWSLVRAGGVFILTVVVGVATFVLGVLVPAAALGAGLGPRRFLRVAFPSMMMAFSTTSSLATLPTMLDAAERELTVSPAVSTFVLPLGASINRPGSALFQAVAVLFVARLYGMPLGVAQLVQAGAAVFLASLTVAAVPAGSVVSLAPALATAGLPAAGLGLLLGLDRLPDMFRTLANVTGHLSAAAVVARAEGEAPA